MGNRHMTSTRERAVALALALVLLGKVAHANGWAGMQALWFAAYATVVATGILPAVCAVLSVFRPRWWKWLLPLPILYVVVLQVVYAREFADSWLVLWNPWAYVVDGAAPFLLHFVASMQLYAIAVSLGLCLVKLAQGLPALPARLRFWVPVGLAIALAVGFVATPGVIGFHYEILVDNNPLENPLEYAAMTDRTITLTDGRVLEFQYSTHGPTYSKDRLIDIRVEPALRDSEYPLTVIAKAVARQAPRKLALVAIPVHGDRAPRYHARPIGGSARFAEPAR